MSPQGVLVALALFAVTLGAISDVFTLRLPNSLTVSTAAGGLALQAWLNGLDGVGDGLAGLMVSAMLFFPLYLLRWMGAGDVKLLMAIGVCLGWKLGFLANMATLTIGAAIGLAMLILFGGFWPLLRRYGLILRTIFLTGNIAYIPPESHEPAAIRFPYAIAIFLGTLTALKAPEQWPWLLEFIPKPFY